jgi:hypothetical protein
MNVTTKYYSSLQNSQWYTRIGSFGFYSAAKPTSRQLRRWKKQVKRFSWSEYKIMVNGHYGKFGKPFFPDYDVCNMYCTPVPDAVKLGEQNA